jgi:hypothetical protein
VFVVFRYFLLVPAVGLVVGGGGGGGQKRNKNSRKKGEWASAPHPSPTPRSERSNLGILAASSLAQ